MKTEAVRDTRRNVRKRKQKTIKKYTKDEKLNKTKPLQAYYNLYLQIKKNYFFLKFEIFTKKFW